jgi:hypothetical protein
MLRRGPGVRSLCRIKGWRAAWLFVALQAFLRHARDIHVGSIRGWQGVVGGLPSNAVQ